MSRLGARLVRELIGFMFAHAVRRMPRSKESMRSTYIPGISDVVEIGRKKRCTIQKRFGKVEGRARETVVVFPSTGDRVPAWPRESRGAAETAERGRRSCRARTQRSPPQFEIGQRDVATFHRSRSNNRSNASRRLIARSLSSIVNSGDAVACGVSER